MYPLKTRFASDCKQQTGLNRSYASLPKLVSVNQYRRHHQQPSKGVPIGGYCDHRAVRAATLGRMPSPEIINIHRGAFYEDEGNEDLKYKEHEFRRGKSMRVATSTQTR
ncbi:unnamed protein product [Callosobruchus maculatus]|uniref:Uncharacterized protein n=1 Tax=Callosobruchus maculatus TaxID=64391 RepID=A0A653BSF5_CALMS|nr:unnamed protein product [Callosobruchus maculatus]